jgi:hypothetical protein
VNAALFEKLPSALRISLRAHIQLLTSSGCCLPLATPGYVSLELANYTAAAASLIEFDVKVQVAVCRLLIETACFSFLLQYSIDQTFLQLRLIFFPSGFSGHLNFEHSPLPLLLI